MILLVAKLQLTRRDIVSHRVAENPIVRIGHRDILAVLADDDRQLELEVDSSGNALVIDDIRVVPDDGIHCFRKILDMRRGNRRPRNTGKAVCEMLIIVCTHNPWILARYDRRFKRDLAPIPPPCTPCIVGKLAAAQAVVERFEICPKFRPGLDHLQQRSRDGTFE